MLNSQLLNSLYIGIDREVSLHSATPSSYRDSEDGAGFSNPPSPSPSRRRQVAEKPQSALSMPMMFTLELSETPYAMMQETGGISWD